MRKIILLMGFIVSICMVKSQEISKIDSVSVTYVTGSFSPEETMVKNSVYKPWRFAVTGGWGRRFARIDTDDSSTREMLKSIRSGFQMNTDIIHYFKDQYGLGMKYSFFKTNSNDAVKTFHFNSKLETTTHFFGPLFSIRSWDEKRQNQYIVNFSIGGVQYKENYPDFPASFTIGGFGTVMDLGYDMKWSEAVFIGFQVSLFTSVIFNDAFRESNRKGDDANNLSRIEVSVGLRILP